MPGGPRSTAPADRIINVLIQSTGTFKITGAKFVEIEAGGPVWVRGGTSMSIQAPSLSIRADADVSLQGSTLQLQAWGPAEIQGNPVRLNHGSKPIARSGDLVLVPPGGMGTIQALGNPTILG